MNKTMKTTIFNKDMLKVTAKDIALIGVMVAVIEVCKVVLMGIPNVELTSFWMIMFALYFGLKVIYVVPVFILVEGLLFGFGLWWVMFLYVWPLLAILTLVMKKMDSALGWGVLSGIFGLLYGAFCSLPYFFIGLVDGGVLGGIQSAFAWWIAGIPFDLIHGGSNFVIMLLLYKPIKGVMEKTKGFLVE